MPKSKTQYVCNQCGAISSRWLGKCNDCGQWNSFEEEVAEAKRPRVISGASAVHIEKVESDSADRMLTGMSELDRVLGGGVVKGSLVLVGGEPGIGKSTLLLQICGLLGKTGKVLYVSGEESQSQIKLRYQRLGMEAGNLMLLSETNIEKALASIADERPACVIVDSIQTMYSENISSAPGSVSQVRDATMMLMALAKGRGVTVFIVGHVTKDGNLAGPRVLEHMVDCVLYFEGERMNSYRILRAVKNRFGSTNEIGVFEMCDVGLRQVLNPSMMLLAGRPEKASGSAVACTIQGARPVLAEIQALTAPTAFGMPRRVAEGVDYNRTCMLLAIIEKKLSLNMQNQDAFVNVVGGLKLVDTACDLSIIMALVSSYKNRPVPEDMVFLGEVGLTGELRNISSPQKRLAEISSMGFKRVVLPHQAKTEPIEGLKIMRAKTVKSVIQTVLN